MRTDDPSALTRTSRDVLILLAVDRATYKSDEGWASATAVRKMFDGGDHANRWASHLWDLEALGWLEAKRVSPSKTLWGLSELGANVLEGLFDAD